MGNGPHLAGWKPGAQAVGSTVAAIVATFAVARCWMCREVAAKSAAGIAVPEPRGAIKALIEAPFFVPAKFMAGDMWALRRAGCSVAGTATHVTCHPSDCSQSWQVYYHRDQT